MDEVTHCEPGHARGCFDLASRGTGLQVTVWPDKNKQLRQLPVFHVRGVPFWQSELELLYKEAAPLVAEWEVKQRWQKLWAAVEEVPIESAIAEDCSH